MKHKIISITGIAVSILMALVGSLGVLYNYGTSGLAFYHPYYATDDFAWETIEPEDWAGLALCALWYFFLIVPWIQYFCQGFRKKSFGVTLTGKTNLSSVFFTVFNVSMIIGSACLLSRPDGYEQGSYPNNYWLYAVMDLITLVSAVYAPWAIVVIVKNIRRR